MVHCLGRVQKPGGFPWVIMVEAICLPIRAVTLPGSLAEPPGWDIVS